MADTYEKDLGQKSSLTTSDFIRVVGSDNVSYKQSVTNVMTAIGIDELNGKNLVSDLDDARPTTTKKLVIYSYNGSAANNPSTVSGTVVAIGNANYFVQYAYKNGSSDNVYTRTYSNSYSGWALMPTRAEINSLNSKTQLSTTYTENDYVTETSFYRIWAYRVGNLLVCAVNLNIDKSAFPSGSSYDNTQIGTITGWNRSWFVNTPSQIGAGTLTFSIDSNGKVTLTNRSGQNCSGFYRTTITIPVA